MARPSSPLRLVKGNLTRAEKEQRENAEKALLTGKAMVAWPEVKKDKTAFSNFKRISILLKKIQKNDALFEGVINRYCLIVSECARFEDIKGDILADLKTLKELPMQGLDPLVRIQQIDTLRGRLVTVDKAVMAKRKMLFDIERENIMTIAGQLRSIPKRVVDDEKEDPTAKFFKARNRS